MTITRLRDSAAAFERSPGSRFWLSLIFATTAHPQLDSHDDLQQGVDVAGRCVSDLPGLRFAPLMRASRRDDSQHVLLIVMLVNGTEEIGHGTHRRVMVDLAKFSQRVAAKVAEVGLMGPSPASRWLSCATR
jgi:hypothetical protein